MVVRGSKFLTLGLLELLIVDDRTRELGGIVLGLLEVVRDVVEIVDKLLELVAKLFELESVLLGLFSCLVFL